MIAKIYYKTPIGYAEITADGDAIIGVELVNDVAQKDLLESEKVDSPLLKKFVSELDEYFNGDRQTFSVKLEARGTDFQKKVWMALRQIPYGKTFSYQDIAVAIGNPKAVRAVGLANSKNPHWVVVPCHRVIGKSGKLTGYAGGLDRKKWLLEHEKALQ